MSSVASLASQLLLLDGNGGSMSLATLVSGVLGGFRAGQEGAVFATTGMLKDGSGTALR